MIKTRKRPQRSRKKAVRKLKPAFKKGQVFEIIDKDTSCHAVVKIKGHEQVYTELILTRTDKNGKEHKDVLGHANEITYKTDLLREYKSNWEGWETDFLDFTLSEDYLQEKGRLINKEQLKFLDRLYKKK